MLDTTAFTIYKEEKELRKFVELIAKARKKLDISCHIPYPTAYKELMTILKSRGYDETLLLKIDTWVVKKTPDRYAVHLPAEIFYEYISDIRERINKGLRVAEEILKESRKTSLSKLLGKLRDKYREALRKGILDSKEDLDVLILAKELNAAVVTADEGIERWAERLGLRFVPAELFPKMLEEYLKR